MRDEHDRDYDLSDGPLDTAFAEELVESAWHPNDRVALGPDPRRHWPGPDAPTADFAAAAAILCQCPMCGGLHIRRDDLDREAEDARPRDPMHFLDVQEMVGPVLTGPAPACRTVEEWAASLGVGLDVARDEHGRILDARLVDLRPIDGEVA